MIAELNQKLFDKKSVVNEYANKKDLVFGEPTIFRDLGPGLKGKAVLDIGVGAGRTTAHLLEFEPCRYVGVDFATEMLDFCRKRFSGTDFRFADARSLTDFTDGEFDFILFSWSGIDCVNHGDRLRILAEVKRVLAPGGHFVFSTANARMLCGPPWSRAVLADLEVSGSLKSLVRGVRDFLRSTMNYLWHKNEQVFCEDYVINLDAAHSFQLLRYNIAPDKQATQLLAAGFSDVQAVDKKGIYRDTEDTTLTETPIYYICKN
jgi:ubiquinone/menaquinone biosynthesis C-methylase UbiE